MPSLEALGLGLLLTIALATGTFFYGQHVGYAERKAEEVDTLASKFKQYADDAGKAAHDGTAAAIKELQDKMAVLSDVAKQLNITKGIMDNAASKLANSLRGGACVLSPDQRRMLECVRRPMGQGCPATGG